MSRVLGALPALIGGALGLYLAIFGDLTQVLAVALAMVAALAANEIARQRIRRDPVFYGGLIEAWAIVAPAATALGTAGVAYVTLVLHLDKTLPWPASLDDDARKEAVKAVVALLVAFGGAIAGGDPEKAENPFWTSWAFKSAVKPLGGPDAEGHRRYAYYAAKMPATYGNEATGWGFKARRVRARILKAHPA